MKHARVDYAFFCIHYVLAYFFMSLTVHTDMKFQLLQVHVRERNTGRKRNKERVN